MYLLATYMSSLEKCLPAFFFFFLVEGSNERAHRCKNIDLWGNLGQDNTAQWYSIHY